MALILAAAVPAHAQGEASAVVTGVIADAQGGVLPGVTVTLRNVESGTTRTVVTEADGQYRIAGLLPGRYSLRAELDGFAPTEVPNLTLTIGLVAQSNLTMALRTLQESVTVTAEAPVVETTQTEVAAVVTQEQIEWLPTANRQAGSLALLLPGTQMPTGTRRARPTVGAGGANANLTTSYVDGGQNQIYNSGQEFLEVPTSGIREFRVNISGASAQYSAIGGVVLTATKSGTNQFHGEAFEFFRDTSLNAMDKFEKEAHDTTGAPKPEYRRNHYGGALGGPIVQNRAHFFAAFERQKEPKTATVRTGQSQFYSAVEGNAPAGYERRQLLLRGDLQVNDAQSVFARFLWDKEYTFCEECGGFMAGNTGTDTNSPRNSLLLAHTWVISSRVLNEVRSQVPPSGLENLGSPPGIPRWPASQRGEFPPERFDQYTGVYVFPSLTWGSTGYSNNNTQRWDVSDDFTISAGSHTLIHAPTGSGKTLAAFLWCLDRLFTHPAPSRAGTRVLYVSPLKALAYDVERNLRAPLAGIRRTAERLGDPLAEVRVASRTGDTPADARRELAKHPPDILVTTPESLYLLLTSQAREILRGVEHVIVDEVHAIAGTKRGAHLALSLERLAALTGSDPQRIGLSATQRPLDAIGAFLGGAGRDVEIVDAGARKELDLEVIVPVDDMARMGDAIELDEAPGGPSAGPEARHSIWPSIHPRLLELIRAHRSTLIFVNSRRLAERLAARLNELADEELVRAHHGSVAREQRLQIEEDLKQGRLPALVATSSLELGIDMGAIDLVVQIEAPPSVASGLQRIGRAGHRVGEPSTGKIFPKYRGDLVEAAVVVERMRAGAIEETRIPRNPLDVLAQQLVAICALDTWTVADLHALVSRANNFRDLSREQLEGVLDMLSGRYPSDEFSDLKPRVVWDRQTDQVTSRNDARVVAITSGGTIPDRGLYGVFLPDGDGTARGGRRVGELDEEMVYESRVGETFLLGASTWRIEEIRPDRVVVTPAPGEPGKMPFWHGDAIGRPIELGRAIGAFLRELETMQPDAAVARLRDTHALDELAAKNVVGYLAEQREVTGALPTDRAILIERFRDELGDWRVAVLTPFGGRVHAPWAMAIEARLRERYSVDTQTIWTDDGIAIRLPEGVESEGVGTVESTLLFDPDEIEGVLMSALGGSALFAARFRENAARALLLPRRRPGQRTPLWMQRQRSADLLAVASQYGSFPIILETYREVLRDVFDVPALKEVLHSLRSRGIRIVNVETRSASPFASSLLFDYVGNFMYEGDAPLAERRAQALALDRELLADLLGAEELRELIDPAAVADLELELQALTGGRRARSVDGVADLLRRIGDLRTDEVAARAIGDLDARTTLAELEAARRVARMRIGSEERWVTIEDVARYRDALGAEPPPGIAETWLGPTDRPLDGLLARWARTHAPFTADAPAARWGLSSATVTDALRRLAGEGTLLEGAFRPAEVGHEFTDPDVLRTLRRRFDGRRVGTPDRGRRAARGRADPGLDPRARRSRGPGARLCPAAARRAGRGGRGGLGRPRRDRARGWADRAVPARPGRPACQSRAWGGSPRQLAPRCHPHPSSAEGRVVLRPAAGGRTGRLRERAARRTVGSRLGRRSDERHVRAASGTVAASIAVEGAPATRPPRLAGTAACRRPLVARSRPRR
jgi:Lhr-like helicase